MNVVGALCVGRLGRANDLGLCLPALPQSCPASCAQVCPSLPLVPRSATVLASPAPPCPAPVSSGVCLRQRPPYDRGGDTPTGDTPNVRCVPVVVVDHQRQPINRIESTNRIELQSMNRTIRSTNRGNQPDHRPPTPRCARTWRNLPQTWRNKDAAPVTIEKYLGKKNSGNRPLASTPFPMPLYTQGCCCRPSVKCTNKRVLGHHRAAQGPHRATNTPVETISDPHESHPHRTAYRPNPVVTTSRLEAASWPQGSNRHSPQVSGWSLRSWPR